VFPVSRPPFFSVEVAPNCALGDIAINSGDFGNLKNICSSVEFAFKGDLRPFDSMVNKIFTFSPKIHPHYLHFR